MAEHPIVEPITEVRALAQASLRSDRWHSVQPAGIAAFIVTGAAGGGAAYMVSVGLLEGWMVPWLVGGVGFASLLVFMGVLECRRMYERAKLLEELFRHLQNYEMNIRDVRNERDEAKLQVATLTAQNAALNSAFTMALIHSSTHQVQVQQLSGKAGEQQDEPA